MTLPMPGDGLRAVNCYAIEDDGGLTMVDSGWATEDSLEVLDRALNSIGFELGDIRRYLVTHVHRDHYSVALAVRRRFGTRIALGVGERPSIDASVRREDDSHLSQLAAWGAGNLTEPLRAQLAGGRTQLGPSDYPDEWLDGPVDIHLSARTLQAVPTPGHTRGHLMFADLEAGLLFAGDHVLPHITPSIGYEPCPNPRPLQDYVNSLEVVLAMPNLRLLPAHGWPTPDTHLRVHQLLGHHDARLAALAALAGAEGRTAWQLASGLPWTRHARGLEELDAFNQMLAVGETAAHLDLLVARGLLAASSVDGVTAYSNPSPNRNDPVESRQ